MKIKIAKQNPFNKYDYQLVEEDVNTEEEYVLRAQNNAKEVYKAIEAISETFHAGVTSHMSEIQKETIEDMKQYLYDVAWKVRKQADKDLL